MKTLKLTAEQQAIQSAIETTTDNLIVQARAGTGKSSTIKAVAPEYSTILCYNKAPAKEMAESLPAGSTLNASTFHSFGMGLLPKAFVDNTRLHWIICDLFFQKNKPTNAIEWERYNNLKTAIPWLKCQAILPDSPVQDYITALSDERLDLNCPPAQIVSDCQTILSACAEQATGSRGKYWRCDFDDMQWLPLVHQLGANSVDHLFVDEAQDLNPIRQRLAQLWSNRVIAVGDEAQAIYAFTGSMPDSLRQFQVWSAARQLPLTVCWRCPSSHLDLARRIVPDIQDRPNCPTGIIDDVDSMSEIDIDSNTGALVICRTNAPLVGQYYRLKKTVNQPVVMVSGDIAGTLCNLVGTDYDAKKGTRIDSAWQSKYDSRLAKKINNAKTQSAIMVLNDHDAAIREVLTNHSEARTVAELHEIIRTEFAKPDVIPTNAIRMSSIHSAKGLEHHHTIVLGTELLPHPMAKTAWEMDVERNLVYVAYTRSKNRMSLVSSLR